MSKHPRPSTFARFGKGLTSRLQNQKIVRHLLTGCPGCESLVSETRFDYSAAFEGVQTGVEQAGIDLARERVQAPGRLQDAFRRLDRVISIGRRLDDGALCGKARMIQGLLAGAETLPALALLLKSAELEGISAGLNQVLRIRESV